MRPLVEIDFVENFGQRFNLLIDGFRKVFSDSLRERIFGFGKLCYAFTSFLGKGVKLIMTFMRIKKTLGLEQQSALDIHFNDNNSKYCSINDIYGSTSTTKYNRPSQSCM